MWSLKRLDTNELIYKTDFTDTENLRLPGAGGGIVREFRMDGYTLLYLKQITNKDLLCSIAQRTLYNVMWKPGWEGIWVRIDTFTCISESLCCPPEIVTTWLIGSYLNSKFKFKLEYKIKGLIKKIIKTKNQAHRYSEQWLPEGRGLRQMKGVKRFKRYKLPIIK